MSKPERDDDPAGPRLSPGGFTWRDGVPVRAPGLATAQSAPVRRPDAAPTERGGPEGPEPTRYGDWEHNGRCSDF